MEAGNTMDAMAVMMSGRDTRWYRGHLLKLTMICFLILITSMTNGYDGSMMNGLQSLPYWEDYFHNPQGGLLGLFNAIQSIGGFASLPIAGGIADRFGRRMGIFIGCTIMIIAVAIQTAAQDIGMFIGARALIGFGLGIAATAAPLLITEIAFPVHRAPITSLYNTTWYLGSIVAAWATFGTFQLTNNWSWRIPSVLQGLPSIIQMLFIFFIPESPRWLVSKGREDQARRVIGQYHCGGDMSDPLIQFEIDEIEAAIELEQQARSVTWISLFRDPGNLKRMRIIIGLAFFSQWSGNGLVSYYLSKVLKAVGITNPFDQTLINGVLQIFNYITSITFALLIDKLGRRVLCLGGIGCMIVFFTLQTICSALYAESAKDVNAAGDPIHPNKSAGHAVIAFIFLYYMSYNAALNGLLVSYTVEILPFLIRAKGFIIFSFAIDLSLIFNQYVNPIALEKLGWKYYIFYCVWLVFEFGYVWMFMLETKGKNGPLSLEEIAALFDGQENAIVARTHFQDSNKQQLEQVEHFNEKYEDGRSPVTTNM
ncbi:general substrate transporter [Kockovaella imperatae]|uniref:General substrate transporter n=1 Tax=Kockovaella imperatae TaxID=4999 RepID=A0A1Y1UIY7_9TREE|nr:general substrate transporter [Kockovaella imperatae]ORX38020.1 general substrate transporter [Kockovaella imperatae]